MNAMQDLGIPPETMQTVPVTFAQGEMGPGGVRNLGVYVADDAPEERKDGTFAAKMKNMDDIANTTQKRYRKVGGKWVLMPRDKHGEYPQDKKDYVAKGDEFDDLYTQFIKKGGSAAGALPGQGMM